MSDLIDRQAAIDAASYECHELRGLFGRIEERLKALPSTESENQHERIFQEIVVEYPPYTYKGKPYFSIKYMECGQERIGFGTFNPEKLSKYLKEYFMPSAQPEPSMEIQEILNYLDNTLHPIVSPEHWNVYSELYDMISALPSAEPDVPERNVGKWIKVGDNSYMCSVCGEVSCCNGNFCPDCGVDMRERRTDG